MERAVSPVVGLLALVVVSLLATAAVAFVVFSGGQQSGAYGVTTSVEQTDGGTMRVTVDSFGSADVVIVRGVGVPSNQTEYSATFDAEGTRRTLTIGDQITDQPLGERNEVDQLEDGDTFRIVAVKDGQERTVRTVRYNG